MHTVSNNITTTNVICANARDHDMYLAMEGNKYNKYRGPTDTVTEPPNVFLSVLEIIGNILKWIFIVLAVLIVAGIIDAALLLWAITKLADSLLSGLSSHVTNTIANRSNSTIPIDPPITAQPKSLATSSAPQPPSNLYSSFNAPSTATSTK